MQDVSDPGADACSPGKGGPDAGATASPQGPGAPDADPPRQDLAKTIADCRDSRRIRQTMRTLLQAAVRLTDAAGAGYGLVSDGRMVFTEYLSDDQIVAIDYVFEPSCGVPGHVMATRQPYLTNDAANDSHVIPEVRQALGFYNLVDVPILSDDGDLLGCFEVHNTRDHRPFDESDVQILQGLAMLAAIALANAALLTDLRRTHQELKQTRDRFLALVEHASDWIWETDAQGRYSYVSPKVRDLLGYEPHEVLGKTPFDLMPPEEARRMRDLFTAHAAAEMGLCAIENVNLHRDGHEVVLETSAEPILSGEGALVGYRGIDRDISQRKHSERELQRRSEFERLVSALSGKLIGLPVAQIGAAIGEALGATAAFAHADRCYVFQFSEDHTRVTCTHEWCAEGIPPGIQDIRDLPVDALAWAMAVHLRGEVLHVPRVEDLPPEAADTQKLFLQQGIQSLVCVPMQCGGRVLGFIGFDAVRAHHDWDEQSISLLRLVGEIFANALVRKERELQLRTLNESLERQVLARTAELHRRAAQLRALALQLTRAEDRERRRIAHILHENLQQLLVAAQVRIGGLPTRAPHDLAELAREVNDILKEAVDTSRLLAVELCPPVLHELGLPASLDWLAGQMRRKHGLTVHVTADPTADPRNEDLRAFVFQSVRELLFNVVKHAQAPEAHVTLDCTPGGELRVRVCDTGKGFAPEPPDAREDFAGRFGLFSIRERAELLGGHLDVHSAPGQGATVTLVVPPPSQAAAKLPTATPQAAPAARPSAPPEEPPSTIKTIRVLLADDHAILRQGLATLLEQEPGIVVVGEAADGQEAIDLALALRPDVVIMDVSMPRLSGVDATRRITQQMPEVKVIGLSMHEDPKIASELHDAGAVAYLTKGGPTQDLLDTVLAASPA